MIVRETRSSHLLLCSVLLLAGCGLTVQQRAAVLKFSAATGDLATVTADEFADSRKDVIEMNKLRVALRDPVAKADQLDDQFTLDQTRVRVRALEALKGYAELLHALVTTSQEAELKAAADSFMTSLRRVNGVRLDDAQAAAIGQAIELFGGLWIEHQRAAATRRVVEVTHNQVIGLLDLIQRDFDPHADHWSLGYDATAEALRGLALLKAKLIDENDIAGQAIVEQARILAIENRSRFQSIAEEVRSSVEKLRKAESNLKYALQSGEISVEDVDAYLSQVQQLVEVYRILR